jgi:hypothetical protein
LAKTRAYFSSALCQSIIAFETEAAAAAEFQRLATGFPSACLRAG